MGNSHSHSHSPSEKHDYEAHDRRWEKKEEEPGIELDKNTRNIRDPALRATLKKTVWAVSQQHHPRRGGGPDSIRLTIPMGDLVPPLSLYARASRPDVSQAELDAIRAEMREFETWAYGEYMGRVRRMMMTMARESGAGGGGGYVSGSRSSRRGRGGGVSFLSGQTTYLPPGVERYKPLRIPAVAGQGGRSGSGSGSGGGSHGGGGGGAEEAGEEDDDDEVAGGDGEAGAEATEGGEGTAAAATEE
ncbi:MAG: hypothetical protein Q9185_005972 [Variospora sp. 1 TL-2023]